MIRVVKQKTRGFLKRGVNISIRFVRKMRISTRLVSLFVLSSFLPLLLIGTWIYRQTSNTLYRNVNKTIESMADQTASYISEKMLKVISDSVEISNSENVQNILRNYEDYDSVKLYQTTKVIIREMSKKYVFNDIVTEITIYTPSGQKVNIYGPYNYRFKPSIEDLQMMQEENDRASDHVLFSFNANNSMILFRQVKDKKAKELIGYVVMRINENCISNIYPDALSDVDIESFIVNSDGVIVSAKKEGRLACYYPDEALTKEITSAGLENRDEFSIDLEDGRKIVNHAKIEGTDWQFISVVSESFFRVGSRQFLFDLLLGVTVFLMLAMIISLIISFSILKPTKALIQAMKQYEENQDVAVIDNGHDELTFMADTFNQMSKRLKKQMEDIREGERQKRTLEIQALQAQINPHFIANTLNLMANIASVNNETGIEQLSNSLVDLMRDCIRNDERFVQVQDEISMLQSYINIQDYRMLGKFTVQMQIEKEIKENLMPHLILQPIVENALLHGILPEKTRRGLISIQGFVEGETMVFAITDNGIGMDQEQIRKMFAEERSNQDKGRFNSIGLNNVQKRIQLLFGMQYGIEINSIQGVYTTVAVRLPVLKEQGGEDRHVSSSDCR